MSKNKRIQRSPSLFMTIPASVYEDGGLRDSAILLYGRISAMTYSTGYCWATNAYLAEQMGLAKDTISSLVKQLAKHGHITIVEVRDEYTNEFMQRQIFIPFFGIEKQCAPSPQKCLEGCANDELPPPGKNADTSPQNCRYPPGKNADQSNINRYNNTPYNPPEGERTLAAHFESFWEAYPKKKDKQRAARAFKRLKATEPMLAMMLSALEIQKRSPDWRKDGGQYVPLPSTWLNGHRWEDEVKASSPATPSSGYRHVVEDDGVPVW